MNACERCVFGSGEHMEGCTWVAKWFGSLKPLEALDDMRRYQQLMVDSVKFLPPLRFPARLGR